MVDEPIRDRVFSLPQVQKIIFPLIGLSRMIENDGGEDSRGSARFGENREMLFDLGEVGEVGKRLDRWKLLHFQI